MYIQNKICIERLIHQLQLFIVLQNLPILNTLENPFLLELSVLKKKVLKKMKQLLRSDQCLVIIGIL